MNCGLCRKPTITPFSALQQFRVCVCLREHYQCLECDKRERFKCALCGLATFVIHLDLEFVFDDVCRSMMATQNPGEIRNSGNDSDSAVEIRGQRNTRKYSTPRDRGRSHSLFSPRMTTLLHKKRSSSMYCTKDWHTQNVPRSQEKTTKKVKGTLTGRRIDTREKCVEESRLCLPNLPLKKDESEMIPLARCSTTMQEPKKPINDVDSYAAEGMRLQMGAPYEVNKSVDPVSKDIATRDIRSYTKEERRALLQYVNEICSFSDLHAKYLVFGCQFLTNRRHMEWLSSEPKQRFACSGIPIVRRVLYTCSNSIERHCELIELPNDFDNNRFSGDALAFPFIRLEKTQLLAKCPDQKCQEPLFVYNIAFHLTSKHRNWLVKYLELNTPFTFQLDLKVTSESVKCHAVIQLQNVLFEYSKYGSNLSLTIMSRHVQLSEIMGNCQPDQQLTLIWVATTMSKTFPMIVNLTLWSTGGDYPISTISYTGKPFDIKQSIRPYHLIKSGRVIILTAKQAEALTQKCNKKVGIQFIARMAKLSEF
ncbi:uncharacterized protein LOC27207538 [Drosophila simulans]|uniref:uncharacterized protein LOC27207538 n=1 Tax=Drosophila simulans TaxID=7240 RepID=UPI00078AF0AF|nr:uncharacterized protein LOC27207538 [Drosophila simulans]XP_039152865.1 uncharacterized protein LOC27207538 [Drosophila simulans]KMZ09459.1 uncharacterized protein Dsimw501_GD27689 [Drosophila simulans]